MEKPNTNILSNFLSDNLSDSSPFYCRFWFWTLVLVGILVLYTQFQWFPTRITEKSHFIVEPRTADGRVDYPAAFDQSYADRFADPEQNGVRMILKTIGKEALVDNGAFIDLNAWRTICKKFDLDPNQPPSGPKFLPLLKFFEQKFPTVEAVEAVEVEEAEEAGETEESTEDSEDFAQDAAPMKNVLKLEDIDFAPQLDDPEYYWGEDDPQSEEYRKALKKDLVSRYIERLGARPWTADKNAAAAEWLKLNSPFLDLAAQAVRKPYFAYYYPVKTDLVSLLLCGLRKSREYGNAFRVRICARLGAGDIDGALDDIESLLRLGGHGKREPTLVGCLIGLICEGAGLESTRFILQQPAITDAQLKRLDGILAISKPVDRKRVSYQEGLYCFDTLEKVARKNQWFDGLNSTFCGSDTAWESYLPIDYNIARSRFGDLYSLLQRGFCESNLQRRAELFQKFEDQLPPGSCYGSAPVWGKMILIQTRSVVAANTVARLILPDYQNVSVSIDRYAMSIKMARIAVALERYKRLNGAYPEQLFAIIQSGLWPLANSPGVAADEQTELDRLLYDPMTGKPTITYRINKQSKEDWEKELARDRDHDSIIVGTYAYATLPYYRPFLLYSWGNNQKDDQAQKLDCFDADWIW